jgi:hypothetical protein
VRLARRRFLAALGSLAVACTQGEAPKPAATATAAAASVTAAPTPAATPRRFDVRTFGAAGDGSKDDAPAIAQAIKAAAGSPGAVVLFPRGRYLLTTTTRPMVKTHYGRAPGIGDGIGMPTTHVLVQDAQGLTLQGEDGAVLVARDVDAAAVMLVNCRNVTVRSLTVDWDRLLFTQGTVTAYSETGNSIDFTIQQGYPEPTSPLFTNAVKWLSVRAAATPDVVKTSAGAMGQVFFASGDIRPAAGGTFRLSGAVRGQVRGIVAGDRIVYGARDNMGGGAVWSYFSEDCLFEKVAVHGCPAVTFGQFYNGKLTFRDCVIEPPAGSGRLISSLADGFYCKYARTGMVVENCRVTSNHDDGFTVHGQGTRVLAIDGPRVTVERFEHFRAGDELLAIDQGTGTPRGSAKLVDAMLVRWREQVALQLTLDAPIAGLVSWERLGGVAALPPRLDQVTSPDRRPDLIADLAAIGSGFTIKGSTFEKHLSQSRVYAANGTIEDNTFDRAGKRGIRVGMDLYLPEVYSGSKLVIRRNRFTNITGDTNIRIEDDLATGARRATGTGNRDIEIVENRFEGWGESAITVTNAESVRIAGNDFGSGRSDVPIKLDLCKAVSVDSAKPITVSTTAATQDLRIQGPITTIRA